jgi:hypothetical protein
MKQYQLPWSAVVLALAILSAVVLTGCGGGDRPELGTVTGRITLDGKPLAGAEIIFQHPTKRFSRGETDADGRYELLYVRDVPGAALGTHRVVITAKNPATRRQVVPPRYNDRTTLEREVRADHNAFDFDLTSK